MGKEKRYTWTVSVIAMVDINEEENGPIMEAAYKEFEDSITSIKNPNKDIKFVIYKYDVVAKRAYIRKSKVSLCRYKIKTIDEKPVEDFYAEGHPHLVDFFDQHVAKKSIQENEEHKHFFIVWGHAAGLGFFKTEIQKRLNKVYEKIDKFLKERMVSLRSLSADEIMEINFITSQTSVRPNRRPHEIYLPAFAGQNEKDKHEWNTIVKEFDASFKVITAAELNEILRNGLKNDISVRKNYDHSVKPLPIIQYMLCLSCYVNMIETRFAFKDLIDIYIAPHTTISFFGYNYRQLFKQLIKKPSSNVMEVAINLTNYYLAKYSEGYMEDQVDKGTTMIHGVDYKQHVAFSCIKLSDTNLIKENIKKFAELYPNIESEQVFQQLLSARSMCRSVSVDGAKNLGIIDYENFIAEFFRLLDREIIKEKKIDVRSFFLAGQHLSTYYPGTLSKGVYDNSIKAFASQSPSSFSIFLPQTKKGLQGELLTIYLSKGGNSEFLRLTNWDSIISLFVDFSK